MSFCLPERFFKYVHEEPNSGCWLWSGSLSDKGYGWFRLGTTQKAHRLTLMAGGAEIPSDRVVDHRCRVPSCVNPAHLEVVTNAVNLQRSKSATKTHCKRGHPLSGENLWWQTRTGKRTARRCRECTISNNHSSARRA